MPVFRRDTYQHTYADYLTWSATHGDEVVNGTAYVREPPSEGFTRTWVGMMLCIRRWRRERWAEVANEALAMQVLACG